MSAVHPATTLIVFDRQACPRRGSLVCTFDRMNCVVSTPLERPLGLMRPRVELFHVSGILPRQRRRWYGACTLVGAVAVIRWTPITGERHAVRTQGNGSGHECGGAVWFGGSARPPVCDGGAIVAGSAVATVMRPERRGRGRRRPESEGLFRWRVGEQCGANWAWMSMRRRLITRGLTHRVLSRRSASRPGPLCRLAWRVGFGGLVAGRASRSRGATTAHAGRQAVLPQSFPREERA